MRKRSSWRLLQCVFADRIPTARLHYIDAGFEFAEGFADVSVVPFEDGLSANAGR